MGGVHKRSFSLTAMQAKYIDDQVASGAFASGSEVIREGLRALRMRDAALERWMQNDPSALQDDGPVEPEIPDGSDRPSPMEKVFDRLGPLPGESDG